MGDVVKRAERARRKERIAGAPENARPFLMFFSEPFDK